MVCVFQIVPTSGDVELGTPLQMGRRFKLRHIGTDDYVIFDTTKRETPLCIGSQNGVLVNYAQNYAAVRRHMFARCHTCGSHACCVCAAELGPFFLGACKPLQRNASPVRITSAEH